MRIAGGCHCGNIAFRFEWPEDSTEIPARVCSCSFCTKHGGVWTSHPKASIEVAVKDPALVSRYTFGTATAEFHTCKRCGIVPVVTSTIEGHLYGIVSANAFDGAGDLRIRKLPAHFEGEHAADRLARRQRNWVYDVKFVER